MTRALTGIQATGIPHLGNYFGMMKPSLEWQNASDAFYFIADLHSFTSVFDAEKFREYQHGVILDWLALGINSDASTFYRQSDIRAHTELTWILLCHTPMGLLERAHAYKDSVANGKSPNVGLFTYPILMAVDILLYDTNIVPVGADQKQHVEIARDIAQKFNNTYNTDIFTLPEPSIREDVGTLVGTDGRKMSKSYGNTIPIFGEEQAIKKAIMGIKTDSKAMGEALDPETCPVFAYHTLFENKDLDMLREQYISGSIGYGGAKKQLFELVWEYFAEAREKRKHYENNSELVEEIMQQGAQKANKIAEEKLRKVREIVGLSAVHAH